MHVSVLRPSLATFHRTTSTHDTGPWRSNYPRREFNCNFRDVNDDGRFHWSLLGFTRESERGSLFAFFLLGI